MLLLSGLILAQTASHPVVVVSWDGAANFVVQRLLREHKLPNVARLVKQGWIADGSEVTWPSKTAVGHMYAFSGRGPGASGVSGNSVPLLPRSEHTLLESQSGFSSLAHMVDPIWVYAAKHGKKVVVLSGAGSAPPEPDQERLRKAGIPLNRFVQFSGFENSIEGAKVFGSDHAAPASTTVGDQIIEFEPVNDVEEGEAPFTHLRVTNGDKVSKLVASSPGNLKAWSGPFWVQKNGLDANVRFRAMKLDRKTGAFSVFQTSVAGLKGTESAEETKKYLAAYGSFHQDHAGIYLSGVLGTPIYKGGNGAAEKWLAELVRLDCSFLKAGFRYGLKRWNPDLIMHYAPQIDSLGHGLMGLMDPTSSRYNAAIAAKVLPAYEDTYVAMDNWLGDMMTAAGPNASFILMSDHGMAGVGKNINLNVALGQAGLLVWDGNKPDLAKTKVLATTMNEFGLTVNSVDWKQGFVLNGEKEQVLDQAQRALLALRDPETGKQIVTRVIRGADLMRLGLVGPACADAYLDFAPDYYPRAGFGTALVTKARDEIGSGVHGFNPKRESMLATLAVGGKGVPHLGRVGRKSHRDIFPTICGLLGIPKP